MSKKKKKEEAPTKMDHIKAIKQTEERYLMIKGLLLQGFFPGKSAGALAESQAFIEALLRRVEDEREKEDPDFNKESSEEKASAS